MKLLRNPAVTGVLVTGCGAGVLFGLLIALAFWSISYGVESSAGNYWKYTVPPLSLAFFTAASLAGVLALFVARATPKLILSILGASAATIMSTIFLILLAGLALGVIFANEEGTYELTDVPALLLMVAIVCGSIVVYGPALGNMIQKKPRGLGPAEAMPTAIVNGATVFALVILFAVIPLIQFHQAGFLF